MAITSIHPEVGENLGLEHKSLVAKIVERLESMIISGALQSGERLVEQRLCEQMGVSRSPLREAFRLLENRGFVTREARRGVTVAKTSLKEAIDAYTIRANLESLATYLAVKRNEPGLVAKLKELHDKMTQVAAREDRKSYYRLNAEFHAAVIEACGNHQLIEMLDMFARHTARYRREVLAIPGKLESSLKKHRALIRSIEQGDAEQAEALRKASILENIELIEKRYNKERGTDED